MDSTALPRRTSPLAAAVDLARRAPGQVLALVLALHLVIWTALPAVLSANLQLDLAEGLAFGREWRLGYWKHPPLPWWLDELAYRLAGDVRIVYLLGPLTVVLCLYFLWRFARDLADPLRALAAVLALEGLHFFNFTAVKFNHDVMQLPFWVLTGWFVHRALTREAVRDWALAGLFLALAFWTKYAAFVLAASIGLFLLLDPVARRAWRTAGPYVMAAVFLVVLAPHLWWLWGADLQPFRYADARAVVATRWWQFLTFPLQWTGSQLFFMLPTIALVALAYAGRGGRQERDARAAFDRRYVSMLALGPFAVTTLIAAVSGRLPIATWGYPLWCFAPLAAVMWLGPLSALGLKRFAAGFLAVFLIVPLAYAAVEAGEPYLRDRPKATQFPGRPMAQTLTRAFREKTGQPLVYVAGTELAANSTAVYSPDRPHVIPYGELKFAPWADADDVRRRGVLLVWEDYGEALVAGWRQTFPGVEVQPPLVLERQTRRSVHPIRIHYAIVPPRP